MWTQRQLPRVPEGRCGGMQPAPSTTTTTAANLLLLGLSTGLSAKPCFSWGSTSSESLPDDLGHSRKHLELREAGKSPDPQTCLSFSFFFFFFLPKGMWHGPGHPRRAHKNRKWNQATGRPFWNRESMTVHTCSEFRASQYFCCRIKREMETSVGEISPASQSRAEQGSAPARSAQ